MNSAGTFYLFLPMLILSAMCDGANSVMRMIMCMITEVDIDGDLDQGDGEGPACQTVAKLIEYLSAKNLV